MDFRLVSYHTTACGQYSANRIAKSNYIYIKWRPCALFFASGTLKASALRPGRNAVAVGALAECSTTTSTIYFKIKHPLTKHTRPNANDIRLYIRCRTLAHVLLRCASTPRGERREMRRPTLAHDITIALSLSLAPRHHSHYLHCEMFRRRWFNRNPGTNTCMID